jgi:hypothetical protein
MANKKISELTAKGTAIAATDLVEISESNGAGGYVTKSVTGANILSSKQDTLVSGTNIKTINGSSVLGSGNLVVTGGGGTAGGPHLITQVGLSKICGLKTNGTATTTCTTATNRMTLMPFVPNTDFMSNIGANKYLYFVTNVITASAVNCKFVVFSDSGGLPLTKLYDGISLSCATTGIKEEQSGFAGFTKGTTYWIGTMTSGAGPTLTQYSANSMIPISETVGGATNWFLSTTSYAYGSIPATVNPALFTASTTNCPAVYLYTSLGE